MLLSILPYYCRTNLMNLYACLHCNINKSLNNKCWWKRLILNQIFKSLQSRSWLKTQSETCNLTHYENPHIFFIWFWNSLNSLLKGLWAWFQGTLLQRWQCLIYNSTLRFKSDQFVSYYTVVFLTQKMISINKVSLLLLN